MKLSFQTCSVTFYSLFGWLMHMHLFLGIGWKAFAGKRSSRQSWHGGVAGTQAVRGEVHVWGVCGGHWQLRGRYKSSDWVEGLEPRERRDPGGASSFTGKTGCLKWTPPSRYFPPASDTCLTLETVCERSVFWAEEKICEFYWYLHFTSLVNSKQGTFIEFEMP